MTSKSHWRLPGLALIATLTAHAALLRHIGVVSLNDWNYFDALSLVVRSAVLGYGTLPLHNPWVCGGLDLMANPQSHLFSPAILLDLAFSPPWANALFLMVHTFIGFIGAAKLLERLGSSRTLSLVGAFLFVHSSWFGLHFAEGHIPFAPMQLIPGMIYLATRLGSRRHLLLLALGLAWMLLDGAIYAVIFSGLAIVTAAMLGLIPAEEWRGLLAKPRGPLALIALGALLVALPKVVPVVWHLGGREPVLENGVMSGVLLARALFLPWQTLAAHVDLEPLPQWRFHEYGAYIGVPATLIVVATAALRRSFRAMALRFLPALLFWLWVGAGWLPEWNPWRLFQRVPLLNNAHVQSRLLLLLCLFFLLLLVRALAEWVSRPRLLAGVVALLVLEALVVRNQGSWERQPVFAGLKKEMLETPAVGRQLIGGTRLMTVDDARWLTAHYLQEELGAVGCYEPSFRPPAIVIRGVGSPFYRGEAYALPPAEGVAEIVRYTPGEMTLRYALTRPGLIELNTNALFGWTLAEGEAKLYGWGIGELLAVEPANLSGTLVLRYRPLELPWLVASLLVGLLLLALAWRRTAWSAPAGPSKGFDYSSFPPGYYHEVIQTGSPVRRAWHLQKFGRVLDCLPQGEGQSLLDIGCFAGTFLSMADERRFSRQLGVDILPEQVDYANARFATPHRRFRCIASLAALEAEGEKFDCVTLIEVIEHLEPGEVATMLERAESLLKPGGTLVITTPNYASSWPLLELAVGALSDVSYEEQHITRFTAFDMVGKLGRIWPGFARAFEVEFLATTHFVAPFLAALSPSLSDRAASMIRHERWRFPFGNLVLLKLRRRA